MSETSAMFVHQMNRNELMPWWFVQVQPNSEEALMTEKKVMDNTWFSLTLGGRNGMDSALPPSSPTSSSCQVYGSPRKPRVGLDTISSTGLSRLSFFLLGSISCFWEGMMLIWTWLRFQKWLCEGAVWCPLGSHNYEFTIDLRMPISMKAYPSKCDHIV